MRNSYNAGTFPTFFMQKRTTRAAWIGVAAAILVVLPATLAFAEFFDPPAVTAVNGNQNGTVTNGGYEAASNNSFARLPQGGAAGTIILGNGTMVGNGRTHTYHQADCPTDVAGWQLLVNNQVGLPVTEYDFTGMDYTYGATVYLGNGVNANGRENFHPDVKIRDFTRVQVPTRNRVYWTANLQNKANQIVWTRVYQAGRRGPVRVDQLATSPLLKALQWQDAGSVPVCEMRINPRGCGDNVCEPEEMLGGSESCPQDCVTPSSITCGDGLIEGTEQCDAGSENGTTGSTCSSTCTWVTGTESYCGDGMCNSNNGEDATSCPIDCSGDASSSTSSLIGQCGDLICSAAAGETNATCPMDCPM